MKGYLIFKSSTEGKYFGGISTGLDGRRENTFTANAALDKRLHAARNPLFGEPSGDTHVDLLLHSNIRVGVQAGWTGS